MCTKQKFKYVASPSTKFYKACCLNTLAATKTNFNRKGLLTEKLVYDRDLLYAQHKILTWHSFTRYFIDKSYIHEETTS